MPNKKNLGLVYKVLLASAALFTLVGLVFWSETAIATGKKAVYMCLEVVFPSLFPFFVVSNVLIGTGLAESASRFFAPFMRKVFNVSGACAAAFILGIVGGYPVGAKTAGELYKARLCTKTEAERLLSFCNNSGPAFILGVVGTGVFESPRAGLLIYAAHLFSSVLVGILFRNWGGKNKLRDTAVQVKNENNPLDVFLSSVTGAMRSVLNISAFVIFFSVAVNLLFSTGAIAWLESVGLRELFTGLIEMTSGLWSLREASGSFGARLSLASFILSFAGMSVHCQALSFLSDSGLSVKPYFLGKTLHACLSALITYVLSGVFSLPAGEYLAAEVSAIAGLNAGKAFLSASTYSLAALLFLIFPSLLTEKY